MISYILVNTLRLIETDTNNYRLILGIQSKDESIFYINWILSGTISIIVIFSNITMARRSTIHCKNDFVGISDII